MTPQAATLNEDWDPDLSSTRASLVRLCGYFAHDPGAAEDLAQQTLFEAWKHRHELRDPNLRNQWIVGIARHVSANWVRSRGREIIGHVSHGRKDNSGEPDHGEVLVDKFDVDLELEREELAQLLDRAMALLPPITRQVLLEHYVLESSRSEIAQRLGLSMGAIAMKLQRGKLAMRRVLTTELRQEAIAHGLIAGANGGWQQTRIWCEVCGQRQLLGRFAQGHTELWLRCPMCCKPDAGGAIVHWVMPGLFTGVSGYKPALSRVKAWTASRRSDLVRRSRSCWRCGGRVAVWLELHDYLTPLLHDVPAVHTRCNACGSASTTSLGALNLALSEGRRFWQSHPRIRTLPVRELEVAGRVALVSGFESVTDQARLDVICARDTLAVLSIHGVPHSSSSFPLGTNQPS